MDVEALIQSVVAIIAIAVSIVSLKKSALVARQLRHHDSLRVQFEHFNELSSMRLTYPEVSHLLEPESNYFTTLGHVRQSINVTSSEHLAQALLRERAFALRVYEVFEHTLFQYRHAESSKNSLDKEFLEVILNYFNKRLLTNPRLAYFWEGEGNDGLKYYLEDSTADYYTENVLPSLGKIDDRGFAPGK